MFYRLTLARIRPYALVGLSLFATFSAFPQAEDATAWHMPSMMPDRVVLGIAQDPSTSMRVNWRTSIAVKEAIAEYAVAGDGPDFTKEAVKVKAATSAVFKSDLNEARYHSVEFTGLKPSTVYAYRVGDGHNWSEWHQFRTTSAKPEPVSFIYVGDAQTNVYSLWSRVIRMAYSSAPETNFILHAGDLINRHNQDHGWGEWFYGAGWINGKVPLFPVPGNHEYGLGPSGGREITEHWRHQFNLPDNGPEGLKETCYYADVQGVRVIGLNSNEKQDEQTPWLEKVLANNPNKWTVVTFHHPIFSASRGRDNKELRERWQPLFDKYKVDMVLTGHDHTYGRSNLISGTNVQSKSGTVYVVSVSGPKMYKVHPQDWMERSAERTQLYQVVRIDGDKLVYESRTAVGLLYDSFELHKANGKPNRLVNKVPNTPNRVSNEQ